MAVPEANISSMSSPLAGADITGTIWYDLNMNGMKDTGEDVFPNIPVLLYRCDGLFIESVLSQPDGSYAFTDIPNGSYKVFVARESLGEDFVFTLISNVTDNAIHANGFSSCFTTSEDNSYVLDGGITVFPYIGDKVWNDLNGNGIQDSGEPGIPNVNVEVYDVNGLVAVTTTNSFGSYFFNNLFPGQYYLKFDVGNDYLPTIHLNGQSNNSAVTHYNGSNTTDYFDVVPQESNFSLDAGFYICAKICGIVYNDINFSDSLNTNENGINGLKINLYQIIGGDTIYYHSTFTGAKPGTPSDDGYYEFCVSPGTYIIEIESNPLEKYFPGLPFETEDPYTYNHFTALNGSVFSYEITVQSGDALCYFNQGYYCLSQIQAIVWFDEDQNGLRDSLETKMQGITAHLYNQSHELVQTVSSDEDGWIVFEKLKKGKYYIIFEVEEGYTFTTPFIGDSIHESKVDGSFGFGSTPWIEIEDCKDVFNIGAGVVLSPLPVEWIAVYAEKHQTYNKIIWKIAKEQNVSHYLVMKSSDGQSWVVIDKTNAALRERSGTYENIDFNIDTPMAYYRIQSVDFDGKISNSDIAYILRKEDNTFIIQPNPANQTVMVSFTNVSDSPQDVTLDIINHLGQIIFTTSINIVNTTALHTEDWPEGLYQAVLRNNQEIISVKKLSILH